jgi:hypothetical protein
VQRRHVNFDKIPQKAPVLDCPVTSFTSEGSNISNAASVPKLAQPEVFQVKVVKLK